MLFQILTIQHKYFKELVKYSLFLKINLKMFSPKIEFSFILIKVCSFSCTNTIAGFFVLDLVFPVPLLGGKIIPDLAKLSHKFSVNKSTVQIETLNL